MKISDKLNTQKQEQLSQTSKPNVVISTKLKKTIEILDKYGNVIKTIVKE
jgi:S-adenosylmethionine hydrolase